MRKKWMALFLVLVFGMVGAPLADAYKGTVKIALPADAPTMDPNITSNAIGFMIWGWAYDTLLKYDMSTNKRIPWLATKWKRLSPTKIKFWLRKGAKFSDGTPVTTAAVQYTMNRIMNPKLKSRQRGYFKAWKKFEIIDDHTFIWHQKWSDNGLYGRLDRWFLLINPKSKGVDKTIIARNTFGGGAYILKSWSKGRKMDFEANPHWWGNSLYPNRPKRIILRRIVEQTTRVKALLRGEVDFIQGVGAQFLPQMKKNPDTRAVVAPAIRIFYLAFLTRFGGPFADLKVRKAVNYAIDAEKMRTTFVGGLADSFHMLYHPWSFSGYNPNLRWYGYNLAKAKKLLKESAYPDGFKAECLVSRGRFPFDKQTCEAVTEMVKKIGIDMEIRAVDIILYRKLVKSYQKKKPKLPTLVFRSWGNSVGDSTNVGRGTSSCTGVWSVSCFPEFDELNEKAGSTYDPKEQQAAFEKVWAKMKELAMHKILFKNRMAFGLRKTLEFKPRGDDTINVWEMVQH
ncbi:ABC transporter substrate-binding protein [Nitrospinota bacterium]